MAATSVIDGQAPNRGETMVVRRAVVGVVMAVWSATLLAGPPSRAPPQQASSRGPWWRRPTAGPITVASDIGVTKGVDR